MTTEPVIPLEVPLDAALPGLTESAQPDAMLALCREHLIDVPTEERDAWTRCTATEAIYQPGRACRVAYELHDEKRERPTIVYARWPAEGETHASAQRISAYRGSFDLFRYPRDRRLRQIRDMRRQDWLMDASALWFRDKLGMGWMSDEDWRCTPIKYVPESRLVCRLKGRWHLVSGGDKWVRAYVRISRLDGSVEQAEVLNAVKEALNRLNSPFEVPAPLAAMPEYHLLATEFVRGTTLRHHAEAGHYPIIIEACRRIARLSQLDGLHILRPRPVPSPGPSLMLRDLVAAAPTLAVHLHTLGDWAHTLPEPPQMALPVHGDLHAGQIIQKSEQFFLVDWDRAALGDPTCDICNLASEVEYRQELMDVQPARLTAMEMIDAWRSANGAFNSEAAPWWFAYACVLRAWGLLRHLRPRWSLGAEWLMQRASSVMRRRALDSGR